ncbi:hypothetical protein ABZ657_32275, partial [Streptomyces sp. NPDC007000]
MRIPPGYGTGGRHQEQEKAAARQAALTDREPGTQVRKPADAVRSRRAGQRQGRPLGVTSTTCTRAPAARGSWNSTEAWP